MSCPQRFCPVRNRNELWFPMKCVILLSLLLVDIIQIYPSYSYNIITVFCSKITWVILCPVRNVFVLSATEMSCGFPWSVLYFFFTFGWYYSDIPQLREYKVWVFKSSYFWVKLKLFDRKRCGQDTLGLWSGFCMASHLLKKFKLHHVILRHNTNAVNNRDWPKVKYTTRKL